MNLRFQFGLRGLLIAVVVAGAFFAGLELGRRTALNERRSAEKSVQSWMLLYMGLAKDNATLIEALQEHSIKVPELSLENTAEFAKQVEELQKKQSARRRSEE